MPLINPNTVNITLTRAQKDRIAQLKNTGFFNYDIPDSCFACGETNFQSVAENDRYGFDLRYCLCQSCGYIFANPYYTDKCLEDFYTQHYAVVYGRSGSEKQVFEGEYLNAAEFIRPMIRRWRNQG